VKELFQSPDRARVIRLRDLLEAEGIPAFVRNEDADGAHVGAPSPLLDPALCVLRDADYERARRLVDEADRAAERAANAPDRTCPACGEKNPAAFGECWACGTLFAPDAR